MPYIKSDRQILDEAMKPLVTVLRKMRKANNPNAAATLKGNLNYSVTKILKSLYTMEDEHTITFNTSYSNINDAIGVLECVKLELYRKMAGPYEDQKEFENDSVSGFSFNKEIN